MNELSRVACVCGAVLVLGLAPVALAQNFGAPMPENPIRGVTFPTDETTINSWVFDRDEDKLYRHGWAIWTGLTTPAPAPDPNHGLEKPLIYQTWLSPSEILDLMNGVDTTPPIELRSPKQHERGGKGPLLSAAATRTAGGIKVDFSVSEVVAYSPTAAQHAFNNKLFWTETLTAYLQQGYDRLPAFPADSVLLKPVYKLISESDLSPDGLFAMPAWPGTPPTPKAFPNTEWGHCVYVDPSNQSATRARGVDGTCKAPGPDNTYGLGDFIHIRITEKDQAFFRDVEGITKVDVGDTLILVGMHVTTRETTRWTWQTFWWSADPARPNAPSSAAIARARPKELTGAAAHYAMAIAYSMLEPAQPLTGGIDAGNLVPAYNPHLEAPFDGSVLGDQRTVATPQGAVKTQYGVQSNCMTCHGLAAWPNRATNYASNFYVSLSDRALAGVMSTDFAWSITVEAKPRGD